MEVKRIVFEREPLALVFQGETLNFTANWQAFNGRTLQLLAKATQTVPGEPAIEQASRQMELLAEALAPMIVTWDLTENGEPLPVSKDSLLRMPFQVIVKLFEMVMQHYQLSTGLGTEVRTH